MPLTPETFQNLERDIEDTGKAVNTDALIEPRYGNPFNSLPRAIRLLMETGGWKAYSTETELLATVPTVNPSVGYAFDTKKLYKWNGTSWTDEGLSPLDLSKSFSKELAFQNQSIAVTAIDTRNRSYNITANAYATYTGWFSYEHRLTGKEQALSGKFAAHYNGAGGNTNTIVIPYITYLDANRIVIASEKDTSAASGKVKEIFSFVPQNAVYVVLSYSTSPTGLPNLSDYGNVTWYFPKELVNSSVDNFKATLINNGIVENTSNKVVDLQRDANDLTVLVGSSGVYSRKQYSEWASLKINLSGYSRIFGVLKGYYKADVKIPVLVIYDASNNIVSYFEATSGNGDVNVSVDTAITANMSYAIVTSKLTSNDFLTLAATKGSTPVNKIIGAVESNGITQADEYYLNLTGAVLDPNVYTGTAGTYNKGSKFAQWYCTEIDLTNARSIEGKAVAYSYAETNLPILIIFDANGTVVHYIDATGSNDSVQEFNINVTSNMAKAIVQFRNSYSGIFIKTRYSINKLPTLEKAYYSLPLFYPKTIYNVANDIDYKVSGQTHTGPRSELKRNFSAVLHLDNFIRSVTSEPKGLTFENGAIQKIIPAYSPVITSGAIENPNLNNGANIYNETVSYKVLRNANEIQRTLLNRSVLNSASKDKTPTILIIGDSVSFGQDAYFAGGKDKWNYTMILNRMFANDKMQNGGTGYGFRTVGTISYTDKDGNKSFNEAYSGTTLQGAGLFTNPKFLDGSNNFSFQNWLDKYRTCDDNGNRLYFDAAGTTTGTAGTNNIGYLANGTDSGFLIGSQISDTMSIDVYKPTHVFCFHCSNAAITKSDYDLLISRVRSTFPNAIIGLGAPRVAGTSFPSHYPNIFRSAVWEYDQTYNNRHIDTIDVLLNSMSTQAYENDKVFVLPTSFVNPAAEAFSTIKINNPYSDIVNADESLLMPVGQRVDVHVGAKAQAAYAYQLYAWLKWTAVSNLF